MFLQDEKSQLSQASVTTQEQRKRRRRQLNELIPELHDSQSHNMSQMSNLSRQSVARLADLAKKIENQQDMTIDQAASTLVGGHLQSNIVQLPEQSHQEVEENMATLHRKTGIEGQSMLTQLQRRATDYQRQQVQEALSLKMLDDPRAIQAFSEEVPITSAALGLTQNVQFSELRARYPQIVNRRNNPLQNQLQCDVCFSSLPQENNPILYCQLCLSATHVKCHMRRLIYAYTPDMTDFICERCRYLIDNQPNPYLLQNEDLQKPESSDSSTPQELLSKKRTPQERYNMSDLDRLRCAFCPTHVGILIYIDRHSQAVNTNKDGNAHMKKPMMIGWTHIACIYWHYWFQFVDERCLEVRQDTKVVTQKGHCKYCGLGSDVRVTSVCAHRDPAPNQEVNQSQGDPGMSISGRYCSIGPHFEQSQNSTNMMQRQVNQGKKCQKNFHVRCAIERGLVADWETMVQYHWEEAAGRPMIHCTRHTLERRLLPSNPDANSVNSNFHGTGGQKSTLSAASGAGGMGVVDEAENDTFQVNHVVGASAQEAQKDTKIGETQLFDDLNKKADIDQSQMAQEQSMMQQVNRLIVDIDEDGAPAMDAETLKNVTAQHNPASTSSDNTASYCSNQAASKRRKLYGSDIEHRLQQEMLQNNCSQASVKPRRGRPPKRKEQNHLQMAAIPSERLNKEYNRNQQTSKKLDQQLMAMQQYQENRDRHQSAAGQPQLSFQDRLKKVQIQQEDKSQSNLENELLSSQLSTLQQSCLNQQSEAPTTLSDLQKFHRSKQVSLTRHKTNSARPDLNMEAFFSEKMNRGERIMYDLRPELATLLQLRSPADRITIQKGFVDFCIEEDLVDLHCHQYNIGRHPQMRQLIGVETMQSVDLFRHLRGLVLPFSVEQREMERRRIIEFQRQRHLAVGASPGAVPGGSSAQEAIAK